MTIEAVREFGQILAAREALWRAPIRRRGRLRSVGPLHGDRHDKDNERRAHFTQAHCPPPVWRAIYSGLEGLGVAIQLPTKGITARDLALGSKVKDGLVRKSLKRRNEIIGRGERI